MLLTKRIAINRYFQVTIRIYKDESVTAFFVFDGRNTSKINWMSKERFKGSSYTDLTNSTVGSLEFLQIRYNIIDKLD